MSTFVTFTKRTNEPKLSWIERQLDKMGIEHKRDGHSAHAPILTVPAEQKDRAWEVLNREVHLCPECNGWDTQEFGWGYDGSTSFPLWQCNICTTDDGENILFMPRGERKDIDSIPDDDPTFWDWSDDPHFWDTDWEDQLSEWVKRYNAGDY